MLAVQIIAVATCVNFISQLYLPMTDVKVLLMVNRMSYKIKLLLLTVCCIDVIKYLFNDIHRHCLWGKIIHIACFI